MKQGINIKYRKFVDLLSFSNGKYEIIDVFKDFVIVYAIAIKNKCYYEEIDENMYFKTIKKYEKNELDIFPKLINELQNLYMQEPKIRDVLGEIYFQIGAIKKGTKQFFSSEGVGVLGAMIAEVNLNEIKQEYNIIYDCACGSGALLLYYADTLMNKNVDYTKKAFYWGQDIDLVCFCMSYIQMSLYAMPGLVIWGDTISLQEKRVFYTPEFFLGGWKDKIEERRKKIC